MKNQQFQNCLYLTSKMFRYPDKMSNQIINTLDQFIGQVGSLPTILSDYRPGDPRQHGSGKAVDVVWPEIDPLIIWQKARAAQLFSGLGIYLNEQNAVSFHFDVRSDRHPSSPALWGDTIKIVYDATLKEHLRVDEYTSADTIVDIIKKKSVTAGVILLLLLAGYMITRH